jgi:signal transduction histidine kinase
MVVDDNQMNADLLVGALTGLKVHAFTDPGSAKEAARHEKFDLFLLDVMMPAISGFDLAREIKTCKTNAATPIIFVSALSDDRSKAEGYNLGSYAYVEKPFNIDILRSQVYNILKDKCLHDDENNTKEAFLAMVTHDLKSPVNAGIFALEYLLGGDGGKGRKLTGLQRELVGDILGSTKYMKNLVDNIMNRYKIDHDAIVLRKRQFCLKSLVQECIEEVKYILNDKNQSAEFACDVRGGAVNADYVEIKRVIHNILVNASEHGQKGLPIEIRLGETPRRLVFSVKNYGSGIENTKEVFTKGFSERERRTGLGLYISKRIIDAHGGKIKALSKSGEYAELIFTLPNVKIC